jgi:hypothetical protein
MTIIHLWIFLLSQKAADLLYSNRDIDVTLETLLRI